MKHKVFLIISIDNYAPILKEFENEDIDKALNIAWRFLHDILDNALLNIENEPFEKIQSDWFKDNNWYQTRIDTPKYVANDECFGPRWEFKQKYIDKEEK